MMRVYFMKLNKMKIYVSIKTGKCINTETAVIARW